MKSFLGSVETNKTRSTARQQLKPLLWLLGSNTFATIMLSVGAFVIARIMSPAEFGRYSLASQIAVSTYPLLTLRFENALPLIGVRRSSILMLIGCLLLLPVTSLALYIIGLFVAYIPVVSDYLSSSIIELLPLVALGALCLALSNIFQSAALAHGSLKHLAVARVARAIAMLAMQIGLALSLGAGATWVFIGEVSANILHAAILGSSFCLGVGGITVHLLRRRLWRRILLIFQRYKEFPLITLPHTFIHSALGLIFTSTLGSVYGADALGQYYLMRKLIFGVLSIFNTAIYQHATAESAQAPRCELLNVALRALALMGSIGFLSACFIVLYGHEAFDLVVGNKWVAAGSMAVATVSLIVLEPMTSTIAFLPIFLRLQHIAFFVAVVQGCVGIAAIGTAGWLGWNVFDALIFSSLSVSLVMVSYIVWLLLRARNIK